MRAISVPIALVVGTALLCSSGPARCEDDNRYSALSDIIADNVAQLTLAFTFELAARSGYFAAPQIAGSTLLVVTPFPHTLYAIDLQGGAAGSVKWRYSPQAHPAATALRPAEPSVFGPTLSGDSLYFNTQDGHTIALDAGTGQVKWDRRVADFGSGETLVSAPLVVGGTVIVGNAGDDFGARGWIAALDRNTGEERWRKYSTGPDSDVGIGAGFRPFYRADKGSERGTASWPPDGWQHGGGTVSGALAYDAVLDQIVHGTGHPAPGYPQQRPGDNKWTSGLFARDSTTGAARWFTQLSPHDPYGLGATNANVLVDRDWRGSERRLLLHADANGFVYVLDRESGEILSAEPFAPVNTASGIDTRTGTPRRNDEKAVRGDTPVRDVCPAAPGANLGSPAYSERSGLLFIPAMFLCMDLRAQPIGYVPGTAYTGVTRRLKPMPGQPRGALVAWDVAKAAAAWTVPEQFPLQGGVLATAGNLVFYGTLDGWLRAVDSRDGHIAWAYQTKSQITGRPITYTGPDNRQYLAVVSGLSGGAGAVGDDDVDSRDLTAASGYANAVFDLPHPAEAAGRLQIFRLP